MNRTEAKNIKDVPGNETPETRLKPPPYTRKSPQEQLDIISLEYLKQSDKNKYVVTEMEAKFGTKGNRHLTKIDYDNVVKKITSLGWNIAKQQKTSSSALSEGDYLLRIMPEFIDTKTGEVRTGMDFERFRIEINGIVNIQDYCKTNDLSSIIKKSRAFVSINKKNPLKFKDIDGNDTFAIPSAEFSDFNFRVSINKEELVNIEGPNGQRVITDWYNSKKAFRYINRVTFTHKDHPFKIELSIVKSSSKIFRGNRPEMVSVYKIEESNVFNNPETFEIEIEVEKTARDKYYALSESDRKKAATLLSKELQMVVKDVLSGLQKTNYPVSYSEQRNTLNDYHQLLFEEELKKNKEEYKPKQYISSMDFIGPSLVTLDRINVAPLNPDIMAPNIREPHSYCVTEKADGDRHLLYVNKQGRIYLINTNMNVIFTGAKIYDQKCFNSLLDGELILHNKKAEIINKFAAFDIYYVNNVDVRARPFINTYSKEEKYFKDGCRLPLLKDFIAALKPVCVATKNISKTETYFGEILINTSPIEIVSKTFYPSFSSEKQENYDIFEANKKLLERIGDGNFDYEIDGLIFTPTLLGVGGNKIGEAGPKKKITWQYIFKWKPSEATTIFPKSYNTIDFLVVTKKGPDGKDIITPIFQKGMDVQVSTQFNQYKTLILTVGFDPKKHGYINPCQDLLDDKISTQADGDNENEYKAKQFFPSEPFDPLAGLCNIMLETNNLMFTEERQTFEDQTVVEFRYDITKPGLWKWVPMRVRYDKTDEFRSNKSVGGNDYKTANSNWHSIHYPVTESMISTGEGIPEIEVSEDVYYNSVTSDKMTQRMRDFHNLYVKKVLIQGVSKKGNILIDFACGKAGDFPKWIGAELAFVFGIDIAKDNIENRLNGACTRYLNFKKTTKKMPYALFVNGNSALNIRSGTNMFNDKANQITKSVFGSIGIDKSLGPAVQRQHNKGVNGFDVSSCQFALHYMFENKTTFYNFIRNVAECTKIHGYFIATCYDGKTIFDMLKKTKKSIGDSKEIYVDEKKIWSVTKQYDQTTFEDNDSCLGYKIDVYQDSINQILSEYLVNFRFLTDTMAKYGFALVTRADAKQMKLPEGSGMFSELFASMEAEVKINPEKAIDYKDALQMKQYEKDISFLNRYFVYQKTISINSEKLTKSLLGQLPYEDYVEQEGTNLVRKEVKDNTKISAPIKLKAKFKLPGANEPVEPTEKVKTKKSTTEKVRKTKVKLIITDDPSEK